MEKKISTSDINIRMYEQLRKELQGKGDLPLLCTSQLRFLDKVKEVLDRKVVEIAHKYRKPKNYRIKENEVHTKVKQVISFAEIHLMEIIQHFKKARKSQPRFVFAYPIWKRKRDDCLAKLTEIADSINSDKFKCNVSKIVGYSVSAFGGGLTLVSAVMIPFSFGLTTPLAVAGGGMIAAGCGTAIGTSVTEVARLNKKVEQAKQLLKEDEEYFGDLDDWLHHASDLQEALQSVLDIDVFNDVVDSVKKCVDKVANIKDIRERHSAIEKYITQILHDSLPQFIKMDVQISDIAPFLTVLVAIFLLMKNADNRVVFDSASVTIRSVLGVSSLISESANLYRLSRFGLVPQSATVAKNFAKAVTRGAVAVVGLALDVVGIVFVSKDIAAGSLSPEAEKIKDAVKKMREESGVLANMYNNLPK